LCLFHVAFFLALIFNPEDGGDIFRQLIHKRNHHETGSKQSSSDTYFVLVSCLPFSSNLKLEATYSAETTIYFCRK
jgi:hypothetical protein